MDIVSCQSIITGCWLFISVDYVACGSNLNPINMWHFIQYNKSISIIIIIYTYRYNYSKLYQI